MQDYGKMANAANAGYQGALTQSINTQPKELGVLQRVDGMRGGLQSLRGRLELFIDRLDGNGSSGEKPDGIAPVSASLTGTLSDAEEELRVCLHLASTLHDRF